MTQAIRLTKSDCIHHWEIEPSHKMKFRPAPSGNLLEGTFRRNGARSPGTCKKCGEVKVFHNRTPETQQLT